MASPSIVDTGGYPFKYTCSGCASKLTVKPYGDDSSWPLTCKQTDKNTMNNKIFF